MASSSYHRCRTCAAAAPLPRQLLLSVLLIVLLTCSTGAYGQLSGIAAAARAARAAAASRAARGSQAIARATPIRPVQVQASRNVFLQLQREVRGQVTQEVYGQFVQYFADVTCQPWCQSYCCAIGLQAPACLNTAGEANTVVYYYVEETQTSRNTCYRFCQAR